MMSPDGKSVWHGEIRIGDSFLFLNDEGPMGTSVAPHGPRTTTLSIQLYVSNVDAWAKRAVEAGATMVMPVGDHVLGRPHGRPRDPFGHSWMDRHAGARDDQRADAQGRRGVRIYGKEYVDAYRGREIYERPPHIFAVAEGAHRTMKRRSKDTCIVISGVSMVLVLVLGLGLWSLVLLLGPSFSVFCLVLGLASWSLVLLRFSDQFLLCLGMVFLLCVFFCVCVFLCWKINLN